MGKRGDCGEGTYAQFLHFFRERAQKKSDDKESEKKRKREKKRMSATVDYQVVIDRLTDAIKELNQPCAGEVAVPISEEERRAQLRADTAGLLKLLLSALEQPAGAGAAGALAPAAAAAEHGASADKNYYAPWLRFFQPTPNTVRVQSTQLRQPTQGETAEHDREREKEVIIPNGVVRWYNQEKGFGGITPNDGSADVFFHISSFTYETRAVLLSAGNLEGRRVRFDVIDTRRGKQASNVQLVL